MSSSPAKLAHIVLWTRQLQAMKDWYIKVLGAHVVYENPFAAFLTYDDEHHRIAVVDPAGAAMAGDQIPGVPKGLPGDDRPAGDLSVEQIKALPVHGLSHVAFTYDKLQDLLETYERLKKESILPSAAINHGNTTSFYYPDPDGNSVELQIDNMPVDEGTKFMESETFARNPIGVGFDPDELLRRLRTGETQEELVKATW
ncbi:biphenyl 2,3-dioxygenase [Kibdelosporangium aridum]|uniref:Biphenyl 2,3-dioxygenase n=1 Tax=Kibdelosporangium aridum TaxID=2030 RepID=A0A428YPM5_KIBAR|nr:VOC family protein [Kibdelosporangium aridum]RSM70520.1 biphenyl 2,3-dioxygenase [Kibdelosporangium aridum]